MSAPKLIEWSRDGRRASLACRYATRYPMVICSSFVLSLYSSCTGWIKLCMTLDSTWCNMYCTGDLLRLLIHGLASIFGVGALQKTHNIIRFLESSHNPPWSLASEVLYVLCVWLLASRSSTVSQWRVPVDSRLTIGIARMHAKTPMPSRQTTTAEMDGNNKPTCPANAIALASNP